MRIRSVSIFTISLVLSMIPVTSARAQTEPVRVDDLKPGSSSDQAIHREAQTDTRHLGFWTQLTDAQGKSQIRTTSNWNDGCIQCHGVGRNKDGQDLATYTWNVGWGDSWGHPTGKAAGLSLAPVDDSLRAHLTLPKNQGLVVTALDPHSFAHQAGIVLNDVLLKLGDTPLAKPEDLESHLKSVGEKPVTLHLLRAGKATAIQVQPQIQVTLRPIPPKPPEHKYWIGVSVTQLEPALRAQLQLPKGQGLIVNEVVKDSPASRTDIKVNDIVLELDGKPLSDSAKLVEVVQSHAGKPILLHIIREGKLHLSADVTPEPRKASDTTQLSEQLYNALVVTRPGAVLTERIVPIQPQVYAYTFGVNDATLSAVPPMNTQPAAKPTSDASADVSKRLDALDADIKQLRQAIEELSKATKEKK
jgi:membrane-associated protease RseP (regulator of RpoE activity)